MIHWIYCREILKSYNLIPAFLRCEIINKNLISVDNPKKIKIKNTPKILSSTKKKWFFKHALSIPWSLFYGS